MSGYLRRNPNDPQDTDYTGYDFWLTKLNQFNGNFVNAEWSSLYYLRRIPPALRTVILQTSLRSAAESSPHFAGIIGLAPTWSRPLLLG